MATKRIVHLRVFRGKEMNYSRDGKVKNVNQLVKLTYKSREWDNYLKHLLANGFCSVIVDKVLNEAGKEIEIPNNIKAEVKTASHLEIEEQPLSESQKENIELKKRIAEFEKASKPEAEQPTKPIKEDGGMDLDKMNLSGLRKAFPTIKATSKEKFIEEVNKL